MSKDGRAIGLGWALAPQNCDKSHFLKFFHPFEILYMLLVPDCAIYFAYSDSYIQDLLGRRALVHQNPKFFVLMFISIQISIL